jgi:hypothetical protein
MFVLGIYDALGVVGIVEIDDMAADMVLGAVELAGMGFIEPVPQCLATGLAAAHPHIFRKKIHPGIGIPHIQRERIFGRKLADGIQRFKSVDPG